jgi:dethiobiotin synthetase
VHRYLLLGTDTDVGKTYVAGALCAQLIARGMTVTACKPLGTGDAGESDLVAIARMVGDNSRLRVRSGIHLPLAAAPSAAARAANTAPPTSAQLAVIARAAEIGSDAIVIESCGGALTPISDREYVADLAFSLADYDTIVVAGLKLGVLSHVFGAAEYLRSRGRNVAGAVLVDRFGISPDWYVASTIADLAARGIPCIAFIPHKGAAADVVWKLPS